MCFPDNLYNFTLVDFHIRQVLPFVHGYDPCATLSPTTKVDHKFGNISAQCLVKQRIQALLLKFGFRKEVRCHNDLLEDIQSLHTIRTKSWSNPLFPRPSQSIVAHSQE